MTRRTTKGRVIGEHTRDLARDLGQQRVQYWQALLARPQLAAPIVDAVRLDVDTGGWSRKLGCLIGYGRAKVRTRRRAERLRYQGSCERAAQWLSRQDRACGVADACHRGIGLWAGRQLPEGHGFSRYRIYPARVQSRAWRQYWTAVDGAKVERIRIRNAIVMANEGLVITQVAKWARWAVGHLGRDDLQQAAREGLFRAADLYDPGKYAFSTYATHWIRHHVFRIHQHHRSDIRAPIGTQALALQLAPLVEESDRQPDAKDLRLALIREMDRKKASKRRKAPSLRAVQAALDYMGIRYVSFQQRVGFDQDGPGLTLADVIPDLSPNQEETLDYEHVVVRLLAGMDELEPGDRQVLEDRFGFEDQARTVGQVAKSRGLTRAEVEDREDRGLAQLRAKLPGCETVAR